MKVKVRVKTRVGEDTRKKVRVRDVKKKKDKGKERSSRLFEF